MHDFRIKYKDGRIQAVTASKYGRSGDRFVFTRDGDEVLNIAADVIESIAFADVAEPTLPEVEVGIA